MSCKTKIVVIYKVFESILYVLLTNGGTYMIYLQTKFILLIDFLVFVLYFFLKFKLKKYIFSIFNISLFSYAFIIFILPFIFFNSDQSWEVLGIHSAASMNAYLNQAWQINLIGFLIYLLSMIYFELYSKKYISINNIKILSNKLNKNVLDILFYAIILLWYIIVLIYNHGIPLFNGGRTFYMNLSISPIYLALNEILLLYALYYEMEYIYNKKKIVRLLICMITILFQGNRGTFLLSIIFPLCVMKLYLKVKRVDSKTKKNKLKKRVNKYILFTIPIIIIIGLFLALVRNGKQMSISLIINEFFYGNTFSDIRDGAFILKGFYNNWNGNFLYGKTYIAALISFLPSSISTYRTKWSYGRFTTYNLFGWENHSGLRGGNVMESFLNFGIFGVVFISVFQGYICAKLEKIFHELFLQKNTLSCKEYFVLRIIVLLNSVLICTSGSYNFYVDILFFCFVFLSSKILKSKNQCNIVAKQM